ncbi:hypothetical protein MNBD_PLANCTO02-1899 [hydrothermal vent metagenome]|uniref:Uncharacterized protein n=1 Tax=hydrothermal vent metagenome TaxID=652676 RepID=A0A3B1DHH0_9ZZZZ
MTVAFVKFGLPRQFRCLDRAATRGFGEIFQLILMLASKFSILARCVSEESAACFLSHAIEFG